MSTNQSPSERTPWGRYAQLAQQLGIMQECECHRCFYMQCGCVPGSCSLCDDTGKRPPDLGELVAMLEEAGVHEVGLHRDEDGQYACADLFEKGRYYSNFSPTPEEAAARLWMAVRGGDA